MVFLISGHLSFVNVFRLSLRFVLFLVLLVIDATHTLFVLLTVFFWVFLVKNGLSYLKLTFWALLNAHVWFNFIKHLGSRLFVEETKLQIITIDFE